MILVTGATGHIGNVLVRELVARGEEVRALVLPGESCDSLKGLPIEMVVGNILDPETLDRWMRGVKLVYHLAGVISIVPGKEELMYRVNVEGARNVARAALKAKARMVHTASVHALRREPHGVTMDERTPLALEETPEPMTGPRPKGCRRCWKWSGRASTPSSYAPAGSSAPMTTSIRRWASC